MMLQKLLRINKIKVLNKPILINTIIIPNYIEKIHCAFSFCSLLFEPTIPDGVSIGTYAFDGCKKKIKKDKMYKNDSILEDF